MDLSDFYVLVATVFGVITVAANFGHSDYRAAALTASILAVAASILALTYRI